MSLWGQKNACLAAWPKGRMDAFNVTRTLFVSRRRFPIECNALDVQETVKLLKTVTPIIFLPAVQCPISLFYIQKKHRCSRLFHHLQAFPIFSGANFSFFLTRSRQREINEPINRLFINLLDAQGTNGHYIGSGHAGIAETRLTYLSCRQKQQRRLREIQQKVLLR